MSLALRFVQPVVVAMVMVVVVVVVLGEGAFSGVGNAVRALPTISCISGITAGNPCCSLSGENNHINVTRRVVGQKPCAVGPTASTDDAAPC